MVCAKFGQSCFKKRKSKNRHNPEKHQKKGKKMKISGASVKGGIQDLFVSVTGEEKQEEVILPNKRCYSVG